MAAVATKEGHRGKGYAKRIMVHIPFGFMPYWPDLQFEMRPYETDPLFVRGVKCALGNFKFPELSVT